mgnify:CR=1 FL=1
MRKDTSFSERKLSLKEFSDKYWKEGKEEFIYQFHSVTVEDGRDEREQLIFNNLMAIKKRIREAQGHTWNVCERLIDKKIALTKKVIGVIFLISAISLIITSVALALVVYILLTIG